jgi:hypothetical protein
MTVQSYGQYYKAISCHCKLRSAIASVINLALPKIVHYDREFTIVKLL